jgi:hypothetical protein
VAGTRDDFDADGFRAGIRFAMGMGAPVDTASQAVFHFAPAPAGPQPADGAGLPFNPSSAQSTTNAPAVRVACSVEFARQEGDHERVGYVVPGRLRVLLLDEDYAQVEGCSYMVLGGDRYDYRYEEPPAGLFQVGIHALVFVARGQR